MDQKGRRLLCSLIQRIDLASGKTLLRTLTRVVRAFNTHLRSDFAQMLPSSGDAVAIEPAGMVPVRLRFLLCHEDSAMPTTLSNRNSTRKSRRITSQRRTRAHRVNSEPQSLPARPTGPSLHGTVFVVVRASEATAKPIFLSADLDESRALRLAQSYAQTYNELNPANPVAVRRGIANIQIDSNNIEPMAAVENYPLSHKEKIVQNLWNS